MVQFAVVESSLVAIEAVVRLIKRLQRGIGQSIAARSAAPDRADQ
jgi:hypothetical protein